MQTATPKEATIPRPDPYCGPAPELTTLWMRWNGDPVLIAAMAALALALWAEARRNGQHAAARVAMAAAVVAFIAPLCAATTGLFAARSVHHLVVVLVMAPAIAQVLAARRLAWWPGAAGAGVVLAAVMVAWHMPGPYAAAWDSHGVYWLMQGALIVSAVMWWHRVQAALARPDGAMAAALNIAALSGVMGLIGAVLTFAPVPMFAEHFATAPMMGMKPLADQQLAGLIMWVPGAAPLAWIALRHLRHSLLGAA